MTKKIAWETKKGDIITEAFCRRCLKTLLVESFYASVDLGKVDTNGLMSVCKDCANALYQEEYDNCHSVEESLHKTCIALNLLYNPDAVEATKLHINTMAEGGLALPPLFSTYKAKLSSYVAIDKRKDTDLSYKDLSGVVYTIQDPAVPVKIIPKELKRFWGDEFTPEDIEYLEQEFAEARQTHTVDTWTEIKLMKEVCYKLLEIKKERMITGGDTSDLVKQLQVLFKSLNIAPSSSTATSKGSEAIGNWIADIERTEPAQWYQEDGKKYSLLADVDDVEGYFQKYFVRPLKNFITGSKDFNIDEEDGGENLFEELLNDAINTEEEEVDEQNQTSGQASPSS